MISRSHLAPEKLELLCDLLTQACPETPPFCNVLSFPVACGVLLPHLLQFTTIRSIGIPRLDSFPAFQNNDMPISVIYFYLRRPDVTPEHFRSYMEGTHVPLIKEVFEMHPPQSLRLRYIARVKTGAGDRLGAVTSSRGRADPDAPVVLVGSPKDVDWDAIGEMVFRDELHVQQCLAVMNGPGGQRIKEDEEIIAITEKTRVILMGEESNFM